MPKDFAGRGRASSGKSRKKRKPARRVSPKQRVLFHGPSFATGALAGAAIVILTAYGPELLQLPEQQPVGRQPEQVETPRLQFDFPDMLKNSEVKADPEPYAVPEAVRESARAAYSIQAASFRNRKDAEQLRASLLLENLPAHTSESSVNGSTWYRVVVGPFEGRIDADRAMTHLREMGLGAMRINDHN